GVGVLDGNAPALGELEQGDARAGRRVLPQEVLAQTVVGEVDPFRWIELLRVDQHFQRLGKGFVRRARGHWRAPSAGRPAATQSSYSRRLSGVAGKRPKIERPRWMCIATNAS